MRSGLPLNDQDRAPWLTILAKKIEEWSSADGAVLACSALKEAYRKRLDVNKQVTWVFLDGSYELLKSRMTARKNHYFKTELLQSQLDTLEPADYGIHVSIAPSPEEIVDEILKAL